MLGMMQKKWRNQFFALFILFLLLIIIPAFYHNFLISSSKSRSHSGTSKKRSHPNIIFITIDTLRADHLSCYGYKSKTSPNIDLLAKKSFLCTNVMAQVPLTLPSHATIFTGRSPISHGIKNNANFILDESEMTLAEVLKNKGYKTAAVIGGFPLISYFGLDQGFDHYDDQLNTRQYQVETAELERNARDVTDAALTWLKQNKQHLVFMWIHYYDPHLPYDPPKNYKNNFENRYDSEINFVDNQIGRLLSHLKDSKLFHETMLVITSDHGEGLGDHFEKDHGIFLYNSTLEIPLILKPASIIVKPREVDIQIATQDIMPTILDILGFSPPDDIDGISLAKFFKDQPKLPATDLPPFYIESYYPYFKYKWSILRGIVWKGYKFVDAPSYELYDLMNDKKEIQNLYQKNNKIYVKLKEALNDILAKKETKDQFHEIDEEVMQKLKSLGYVGSDPDAPIEDISSLPDPKSRIQLLQKIEEAKKLLSRKDYKSAVLLLERVMQQDKTNPVIYNNLGIAFRKLGDRGKAFYYFREGLKHDPGNAFLHNNLGLLYREQGEYSLAIKEYQASIHNDPLFLGAYVNLSVAQFKSGKKEEAIKTIEKVLEQDPNFPEARRLLRTFENERK
jgi:arylsulfatase A-like enzyme